MDLHSVSLSTRKGNFIPSCLRCTFFLSIFDITVRPVYYNTSYSSKTIFGGYFSVWRWKRCHFSWSRQLLSVKKWPADLSWGFFFGDCLIYRFRVEPGPWNVDKPTFIYQFHIYIRENFKKKNKMKIKVSSSWVYCLNW